MSMTERVHSLKTKHARLEQAIEAENSRPNPDIITLKSMKLEKLRVKEEIEKLVTH